MLLICLTGSALSLWSQKAPVFEMRGVWVATVVNIDWPAEKGMSVEAQKADFIRLLDMQQRNGMNAVFVQIRPAADAFYPSSYEPWSEFLNGKQGLPPTPYYDPLEFMIEETHQRGMEFHAWLNPYRAVFNIHTSSVSPSHITKIHPEWFVTYGNTKYFNPGLPEVRQFVTRVVKDIVTRYKVDGIHMDDYFYPYRIAGKEFPDEKAYRQYGNGLSKDEWRRSNCDSIIHALYQTIRAVNPFVKFGISPFGVWRNNSQDPDGSNTKAGQTNYDDLYADILLWLKKGWIDYVAPQLYWEQGHKLADFDTLLAWWNAHTYGRDLYIGQAIYRAGTNAAWRNPNELPNQLKAIRSYSTTQGSIFFSSKNFESNPNGWSDSLRYNYYALPAIVPPMQWIDSTKPPTPIFAKSNGNLFTLHYSGKQPVKAFAIFALPENVTENIAYATLIKLLIADKEVTYERLASLIPANNRLFAAVVSEHNVLSNWIELK
ncbi:glycoside hydrolase family 10 protein [Hydrotalea flava]|uniref:glycoside hydrolase family 10 protein n=1 Tax=Hydrotalea flava TaxID=714549 RepID=UPI0020A46C94|nr:family 10 glycosylhydrolase [Hydrotalea flava]